MNDKQLNLAYEAAADISAAQYHIVRISDGDKQVNIGSLATHSSMLGVLQNKPAAAGRNATVCVDGPSKVVAGAAISSAGVFFTTNGSGRAVAATSGDMACGRIIETAAANGDVINVLVYKPFRLSGAI